MAAILDDEKVCTHCGHSQPVTRFKRRSRAQGRRLSWCKVCVNESARLRTARKRAALIGEVSRYTRLDSPASRVECVVAAACRKAGGIELFADRLVEALKSPNVTIALSGIRLFHSLLAAQDRLRLTAAQTPDPFANLPDDELNEAVRQRLIDLLANVPESLADALRALGWHVERPSSES